MSYRVPTAASMQMQDLGNGQPLWATPLLLVEITLLEKEEKETHLPQTKCCFAGKPDITVGSVLDKENIQEGSCRSGVHS